MRANLGRGSSIGADLSHRSSALSRGPLRNWKKLSRVPGNDDTWNLTIRITATEQTFSVNIVSGSNPEIFIDWGDGIVEYHTSIGLKTHVFLRARDYTVRIYGKFSSSGNIRLGNNANDRPRLVRTSIIPFISGLSSFDSTFYNCTGLTAIPANLFDHNTSSSTDVFSETFSGCTGLTSIPTDLFRYNTAAGTFYDTFRGCSSLTSLPIDLFRYNTAVSGFANTFSGCTRLTAIPTDLFRYNTSVSAYGFQGTFGNCSSLTSIPTDLFKYNTSVSTNGFYSIFNGCTGLTSIPTDLFRYNTAVGSNGFIDTFNGCTGITSLPADFFRYNTSCTSFNSTFYNCTGLTSLPTDLFRYNTACLSFANTFYGCNKLTLRSDMFCAAGDEVTRFNNQSVDFTNCMRISSFTGTKGTAPALWNFTFGSGTPTKTTCFNGHSTNSVDNYSDIPAAWR